MELIQPFKDALASDWQSALERDEWFFTFLEDDISDRLSPSQAFAAIDEITALIHQQTEPFIQWRCGLFLNTLSRRSNTTEMPPGLQSTWQIVVELLSDFPDIVADLRSWYRRP